MRGIFGTDCFIACSEAVEWGSSLYRLYGATLCKKSECLPFQYMHTSATCCGFEVIR